MRRESGDSSKHANRKKTLLIFLVISVVLVAIASYLYFFSTFTRIGFIRCFKQQYQKQVNDPGYSVVHVDMDKLAALADAALKRTEAEIEYDPSYFEIPYPRGDVPPDKGVCADVVIRSFRAIDVDLQELVHEDISSDFLSYPRLWFTIKPDTNIDHRRVQNLSVFLLKSRAALPITDRAEDYLPGDVIVWWMHTNRLHIGVVVDEYVSGMKHRYIVHNIGKGPMKENRLFKWRILGHFRYTGNSPGPTATGQSNI